MLTATAEIWTTSQPACCTPPPRMTCSGAAGGRVGSRLARGEGGARRLRRSRAPPGTLPPAADSRCFPSTALWTAAWCALLSCSPSQGSRCCRSTRPWCAQPFSAPCFSPALSRHCRALLALLPLPHPLYLPRLLPAGIRPQQEGSRAARGLSGPVPHCQRRARAGCEAARPPSHVS